MGDLLHYRRWFNSGVVADILKSEVVIKHGRVAESGK
jgi:hypothetical protein